MRVMAQLFVLVEKDGVWRHRWGSPQAAVGQAVAGQGTAVSCLLHPVLKQ